MDTSPPPFPDFPKRKGRGKTRRSRPHAKERYKPAAKQRREKLMDITNWRWRKRHAERLLNDMEGTALEVRSKPDTNTMQINGTEYDAQLVRLMLVIGAMRLAGRGKVQTSDFIAFIGRNRGE